MYVCMYVYACVCMYVCASVCMYVMYVCAWIRYCEWDFYDFFLGNKYLIHTKATYLYSLILHPDFLLQVFVRAKSFPGVSSGSSKNRISANRGNCTSSCPIFTFITLDLLHELGFQALY